MSKSLDLLTCDKCLPFTATHFSLPELLLEHVPLGHLFGAAPAQVPEDHAAPIIIL